MPCKEQLIIKAGLADGLKASEVKQELEAAIGVEYGLRRVQRMMKRARARAGVAGPQEGKVEQLTLSGTGSETAELKGTISGRVVTLEDALKKGNVDLTRWDVDKWEITSWEVGAKTDKKLTYEDKRLVSVKQKSKVIPLWRVSVKLKAKRGWSPSEFRKMLLSDMKKLAPSYRIPEPRENRAPILAELSIFDAHFGKLAWAPETGQDYDLKICKQRYLTAARDLIGRAGVHKPERFLIVFGNDFFHVDHKGLTTAGTPQDMDGRWQKAFRIGWQCCVTVAEEAAQIAPVDILIVPGNHDREKAFCLGEVLGARFHQHPVISVQNEPDLYSYYRWGKVLLGFVHGDNHGSDKKRAQLPQQMSTDRAVDWSETVWREWHLGHFHSEREDVWHYRKVEHVRDLAVRILPSLSSTDAWHRSSGYASVLAAECHLYHKQRGRYAYLTHQTTP
jgi:hypothetical protein